MVGREDLAGDYLTAVERELAQLGEPRPVRTLYFGGGTPTRLPAADLQTLCEIARRWFPPVAGCEWTVEANPRDISPELLGVLAAAGVNRLSLGGQSFNADKLSLLERDHTGDQLRSAVSLAQEHGFEVSVDLIFGTPGESLSGWLADLDAAATLGVGHVSTYGLTFEKGAAFWSRRQRGDLVEVDEELQRQMYLAAIDRLTAAGFEHYEVSNFALPGRRSRHNEVYWSGDGYYAAGPGAARYVDGVRETNHGSTTTYLRRVLSGESPVAEREQLAPEQRARERLIFGLRRLEGVDQPAFAAATGFEVSTLGGAALQRFLDGGLLEQEGTRLRLTRDGLLLSDSLWPELL